MREWKISCDHCGIEIKENPFTACIERVGREEDAHVVDGKTIILDLCERCVDELLSWKMVHASASVSQQIQSKDLKEKPPKE